MKYIEEMNIHNKNVLLRLDLNVPIKDGKIIDDNKIIKSLKTIKYLLDNNNHILIMSHLGKIKSEEDKNNNSLEIVCEFLKKVLNEDIYFIRNTRDSKIKDIINDNRISMLENTRFEDYPNKLESNCDEDLSKYWASLGDVFINDAFGTTHRRHASNYGISKYIESGYGFLIKEELDGLDPLLNNIKRPFTVIMGGAKIDDKLDLISSLIKDCDYLLVGGGIANTFLFASDYNVGKSLYNKDVIDIIKNLLDKYNNKIIIPVDVVVENNNKVIKKSINEILDDDIIYDIGSNTVDRYKEILVKSKTVFVNGTMGLYENDNFKEGTNSIYKILLNCNAIKIAGGGDAVSSINNLNYSDAFNYLSTGGGATLDYISYKKLKCFED